MKGFLYKDVYIYIFFLFQWSKYLVVGSHHLLSRCLSEVDKLFSEVANAFYILTSDVGEIWLLQVLSNSWTFSSVFAFHFIHSNG